MFVSRAAKCSYSSLKHVLPEAGLVREGLLPVIQREECLAGDQIPMAAGNHVHVLG